MKLLVLRPEPGAGETAARARRMGLDAFVSPLFEIRPIAGPEPDSERYDAVLITSANGARHAPSGLAHLACYAVGEASAAAARDAGFADIRVGPSDGEAAAALMARDGVKRAIHPCGRDHLALEVPGVAIEPRAVYCAEPLPARRFEGPAVAMIHSPRAGARFAALVDGKHAFAIAAISAAAAAASGEGWAAKAVAAAPRDSALLELAAKLCNHGLGSVKDGTDGL